MIGKSEFVETEAGYDIKFTRHKRIKILKKGGAQYADVTIPFYYENATKSEEIKSLKAYTYNLVEGNVRGEKVSHTTIFEEKINKNWKVKKFTFPNIQEGSIIEFEYELLSPFKFNLPDWEFQNDIPTLYSKYVVNVIPFYEYVYITDGIPKFDEKNSELSKNTRKYPGITVTDAFGRKPEFQDVINTYVMKDVPAFEDESFITSRNDYIMQMDFQLSKVHSPYTGTREIITTWPKMIKSFLEIEEFGKYLKNINTGRCIKNK